MFGTGEDLHPDETMSGPRMARDPIGEVSYSKNKEKTPQEATGVFLHCQWERSSAHSG
jgi:hypothetical protein